MSEALFGALLALQAPAALASACTTGVIVDQWTGTGAGSLYNAFNNNCVELSTTVANRPIEISLDQSYTLNGSATVYLDTVGPMTYWLGASSGNTLAFSGPAVGALSFDALPAPGTQSYGEVILGQSSSGLTLGREIHRGAWALAVAGGTLQAGVTRDGIGDGVTTQLYRVGVFASRPLGALQLGTLLGYSQGQLRYGMARRQARMLSWQSRLGRDVRLSPRDLLNPVLGLDVQALRLHATAESDPLLGLQVPAQRAYTASLLAALREVHAWEWGGASGEFSATLGLRHWLRRPPGAVLLRYNGIPDVPFTTSTEAPPRNLLEAGIGLHAQLRGHLSAELSLRGDYGRSVRAGKIEARLEWGF